MGHATDRSVGVWGCVTILPLIGKIMHIVCRTNWRRHTLTNGESGSNRTVNPSQRRPPRTRNGDVWLTRYQEDALGHAHWEAMDVFTMDWEGCEWTDHVWRWVGSRYVMWCDVMWCDGTVRYGMVRKNLLALSISQIHKTTTTTTISYSTYTTPCHHIINTKSPSPPCRVLLLIPLLQRISILHNFHTFTHRTTTTTTLISK